MDVRLHPLDLDFEEINLLKVSYGWSFAKIVCRKSRTRN